MSIFQKKQKRLDTELTVADLALLQMLTGAIDLEKINGYVRRFEETGGSDIEQAEIVRNSANSRYEALQKQITEQRDSEIARADGLESHGRMFKSTAALIRNILGKVPKIPNPGQKTEQ